MSSASTSSHALTVRQPRALVMDVMGTLTKTGFIEEILLRYVHNHLEAFLQRNWGNTVLMRDIDLLRDESHGSSDGSTVARVDASPDDIQHSVADYVKNCIRERRFNEPIRVVLMHMIFDGYAHGSLVTHVYTDVAVNMKKWAKEGIPIYVLSNGYKVAMRRFMQKTNHDNLDRLVKDYFDTSYGSLTDQATYHKLVAKLGHPPEDVLFLTHSGVEGVSAYQAGLSVILVATHREDVHRERSEQTERCGLPIIRTFKDLAFENDAPPASSMADDEAMSSFITSQAGSSYSGSKGSTSMSGSCSKDSKSSSAASSSSTASSSKGGSSSSAGSSKGGSSSHSSASRTKSGSAVSGSSASHGSSASSATPSRSKSGTSSTGKSSTAKSSASSSKSAK